MQTPGSPAIPLRIRFDLPNNTLNHYSLLASPSLAEFVCNIQDFKPPPGLTGDIIKDTVLVDKRVEQLSSEVAISQPEKVRQHNVSYGTQKELLCIRVDTKMPFFIFAKMRNFVDEVTFLQESSKLFIFSYKVSETHQNLYNYPALLPCLKYVFAKAFGASKYFREIKLEFRENFRHFRMFAPANCRENDLLCLGFLHLKFFHSHFTINLMNLINYFLTSKKCLWFHNTGLCLSLIFTVVFSLLQLMMFYTQETLRLHLMTHGLNNLSAAAIYARGRGGSALLRPRGRGSRGGRGRGNKSRPIRPRVIKCDKCGYEFPAEVNERILVEHITKYHMKEQLAEQQQRRQLQLQQRQQQQQQLARLQSSPNKAPVHQVRGLVSLADTGSGIRCLFDPWIRDPE